jgi:pimeloyl-ACP methyl ester carboxylesterase
MGAVLAAAWAATLAVARVRALVLVSLPLFESASEAASSFAASDPVTWLTVRQPRLAKFICRRTCGQHGLARRLASLVTPRDPVGAAGSAVHAWRLFPEATFLHTWESLSRSLQHCLLDYRAQPALEQLGRRGVRLVFVHGEWDRLTPYAPVARMASRLDATLITVPHGTHALQLTHARVIAAAVRELLDAA